ncbi:MAG: zinc ribbon domain-containing protein [Chloroflexi bacterium]|nr:zinc ribbon domain-containing protein [Chloroflexota bacterium]
MPIYEYTCQSCGHAFEKLVSASARNQPMPCPACGSTNTSKVFSVCAASRSSSSTSAAVAPCSNTG